MAVGSERESPERNVPAPDRLDQPFSDPLVQRLFPPLASGVHWGLERTAAALEDWARSVKGEAAGEPSLDRAPPPPLEEAQPCPRD